MESNSSVKMQQYHSEDYTVQPSYQCVVEIQEEVFNGTSVSTEAEV